MKRRFLGLLNLAVILFGALGVVISVVAVVGAAIYYAPVVEGSVAPVVVEWRAEATREVGGATILHVYGDKRRRECAYVREDMMIRPLVGLPREVAGAWVDDPTPGSTRPPGRQDFGFLRVFTSRETPAGTEIFGVAHHACHAGPPTLTPILGPGFVVPPLPIN